METDAMFVILDGVLACMTVKIPLLKPPPTSTSMSSGKSRKRPVAIKLNKPKAHLARVGLTGRVQGERVVHGAKCRAKSTHYMTQS